MSNDLLGKLLAFTTEIYKCVSSTNTMNTYNIDGSGLGATLKIPFTDSLILNDKGAYKLEILRASFIANVKNITDANNKVYLVKNGVAGTITIPPGQYEYTDLFSYLAGRDAGLVFAINANTSRCMMTLPATYVINNTAADSFLSKRCGFTANSYTGAASFTSETEPSISEVDILCLCCDKVEPQTFTVTRAAPTTKKSKAMWSIPYADLRAGRSFTLEKISELYLPLVNAKTLSDITFYVTDQDGNIITDSIELSVFARIVQIREG